MWLIPEYYPLAGYDTHIAKVYHSVLLLIMIHIAPVNITTSNIHSLNYTTLPGAFYVQMFLERQIRVTELRELGY